MRMAIFIKDLPEKGIALKVSWDVPLTIWPWSLTPFVVNLDYFACFFATILLSHSVPPLALFFTINYITRFEITVIQMCA